MAEGDISIRHAVAADLPAVRALLAETWHDTYDALLGTEWVTEVSGRWHAIENLQKQLDVPGTSFLVAVDQGRIVGHILADARKSPDVIISRLYVLPAHQRGGVGARLLAAATDEHHGAKRLRLDVDARNEKGVSFYRRAGFTEVGRTVVEGSEHLVMEKRLAPSRAAARP
jgi:ribosomal protein S18 acetylase RimI-like enzyme